MTSDQISQALYSGQGIKNEFWSEVSHKNITFTFDTLSGWLLDKENPNITLASQISQAVAAHSLTVQKASDVTGLGYRITETYVASGGGTSGGAVETWNQSATGVTAENGNWVSNVAPDGKHHLLINPTEYLGIYLSW